MHNRSHVRRLATVMIALVAAGMLVGCGDTLKTPTLLLRLPDSCNTPDGMTLDAKGNIILSVPNFNDDSSPSRLMKIDPQNRITEFYRLPVHPETGKVCPMGLDFGPDGHLYVADNQYFASGKKFKSRLLRIVMSKGKPVRCETAVDGFKVANAVIWRGDEVFVSDTIIDEKPDPMLSGIYRVKLSECRAKPLQLLPDAKDPHLIAKIWLQHKGGGFGADGLTFDKDGNLYCGNFHDGTVHKITFDAKGKVTSNTIFAKHPKMTCCDGIFYDETDDVIYVADMICNGVQKVDMNGRVTTIARNGDTDGTGGLIDQPCEVIVRGRELIVVNMDWPFPGIVNTTFDKPYTLSVIQLDD